MTRSSPQEKKRLSYAKDRRNTYGESPHGARKSIPRNKRIRSRVERHAANEPLRTATVDIDEEAIDAATADAERKRKKAWKKYPDQPLGEVVKRNVERRAEVQREGGRRAARRKAQSPTSQ